MTYVQEWLLRQERVECGECHMFAWFSDTVDGGNGMRYHPDHLPNKYLKPPPVTRLGAWAETFSAPSDCFADRQCLA